MTAHGWQHHPTTSGPVAGRETSDERCERCKVRRTPAAEHVDCPPPWQDDGQI